MMLYSALTGALLITVHFIQILLSMGLLNNLKDKWRMKPGRELTLSFMCWHVYHNQLLVDTSSLSAQLAFWSSPQEAEKGRKELPIPSSKQQAVAAVLKETVCVSRSYTAMLKKFVSATMKAGPSAFLFYSIHKMHITEQLCQRQGIFLDRTTWK